jgi:hypothetical protein
MDEWDIFNILCCNGDSVVWSIIQGQCLRCQKDSSTLSLGYRYRYSSFALLRAVGGIQIHVLVCTGGRGIFQFVDCCGNVKTYVGSGARPSSQEMPFEMPARATARFEKLDLGRGSCGS